MIVEEVKSNAEIESQINQIKEEKIGENACFWELYLYSDCEYPPKFKRLNLKNVIVLVVHGLTFIYMNYNVSVCQK